MKISVVVAVYNSEQYLPECIDSIIRQTYRNLEIILVDDGSTDKSSDICDHYEKIDKRIRVIHQMNQGVSAARNCGLDLATGDLISFVDSDDTLDEDMYELLVDLIEKYHADIAHCGYKHIVGDEIRLVHDTKEVVVQEHDEALKCLVGGHLFVGSLWNKIYKKELIGDLKFRLDLKINEDILYNFELFRKADTSVFADYAKYNYIAHVNSSACFITPSEKKMQDSCEVNRHIYQELSDTPLRKIAGERYVRSLSGYYRFCIGYNRMNAKTVAAEMWKIFKNGNIEGRNMKVTVILVYFCPWLYRGVYSIYNRVRKPNWEV